MEQHWCVVGLYSRGDSGRYEGFFLSNPISMIEHALFQTITRRLQMQRLRKGSISEGKSRSNKLAGCTKGETASMSLR